MSQCTTLSLPSHPACQRLNFSSSQPNQPLNFSIYQHTSHAVPQPYTMPALHCMPPASKPAMLSHLLYPARPALSRCPLSLRKVNSAEPTLYDSPEHTAVSPKRPES